ncbi:MAG: phosphodiester glycosidase family protein [Gammaproteobacteria bacterium]
MQFWRFLKWIGILFCFFNLLGVYALPTTWRVVQPGLEYARLTDFAGFPGGYIHAFRIDLSKFTFNVVNVPTDEQGGQTIPTLMQREGAIIATNGGFFSPDFKPLGLRINAGQQSSHLHPTAWWGVFYIQQDQAKIVARNLYHPEGMPEFALQAGPRLLIDGKIPQLKPDIDDRTAMGITADGKVILLATENVLLSTGQLAEIMQRSALEGGLDCVNAINLDGGHSTQIYTRLPNLNVQVSSFAPVADVVLVRSKK